MPDRVINLSLRSEGGVNIRVRGVVIDKEVREASSVYLGELIT